MKCKLLELERLLGSGVMEHHLRVRAAQLSEINTNFLQSTLEIRRARRWRWRRRGLPLRSSLSKGITFDHVFSIRELNANIISFE